LEVREIKKVVLYALVATLLVAGVVAATTEQTSTERDKIVQKSLEIAGGGWTYVGMYILDPDNMDTLVILKKSELPRPDGRGFYLQARAGYHR